MNLEVRAVQQGDIPAIKEILNTIELFPAEYLEGMISNFFNNSESGETWLAATENGKAVGFCYCRPEQFTAGTHNLLAIGVHAEHHGKGCGSKIIRELENRLKSSGNRVLIIETSSSDAQAPARRLYEYLAYELKGVLPEFWMEGDDKLIFWRKL